MRHGREVAVKVLDPELAAAIGPERFLKEIRTTASLHHPHIVSLYDSGKVEGGEGQPELLFYVMPRVEGESLEDRLAREGRLPIEEALGIAREVADALSYAHERGVVHRDVKPGNILLEGGHALVADFGLARAIGGAGNLQLTQAGTALGTPLYMSPEQATGSDDVDGRSDLYSLGCVLHEMLAGEPPFTGKDVVSVLRKHVSAEPPRVTELRPEVPAQVADVLRKALAKDREERFSPVARFGDALRESQLGLAVSARAPHRRPRLLGVAAVLVVGALAVFALRALLAPSRAAAPVPGRSRQLTFDPGLELDPALSPDGTLVAYCAGVPGDVQVFVRQVDGDGPPIALSASLPGDHRLPRWSPDGARVSFEGTDGVFETSALGGAPRRLFEPADAFYGNVVRSPDGQDLVYSNGHQLVRHTLATGAERKLAEAYEPHMFAWSPDGARIAYVSGNPTWGQGTMWTYPECSGCGWAYFANASPTSIWTVAAGGGAPVRVTDDTSMNLSPVWLPGGELLFLSDRGGSRDVYFVELGRDGAPATDPLRLTTGLDAHSIAPSADGRLLAYAKFEPRTNVWALPIDASEVTPGAGLEQVTRGNQWIETMAVSPDGRRLAFDSDRSGNQQLYTMDLGGGEPVRVTQGSAPCFVHSWSADGRWLGGHTIIDGVRHPFLAAADGARFELVHEGPTQDRLAQLSPDGTRVLFDSQGGPLRRLMLAERAPGGGWDAPTPLTDDEGRDSYWSPDGHAILHTSGGRVRLVDPDTREITVLVDAPHEGCVATFPVWSLDGRTVYYSATDRTGESSYWSVPTAGGEPRQLVRFTDPARSPSRPELAVDETRFYFTLANHESDVWVLELE